MPSEQELLIERYGPQRYRIKNLFLDSGAHSLYTEAVLLNHRVDGEDQAQADRIKALSGREVTMMRKAVPSMFKEVNRYEFYETDEFWAYVDQYAAYCKAREAELDYYVTVDAIFNPEITWKVQRYLEDEWKLNPMPVIHANTPYVWIKRYLKQGYELLGIGGLGQEVRRQAYYEWANGLYTYLCNNKKGVPCVRTHGFAMTSPDLMTRYPWWSVDSATWIKGAAFGMIFVPRMKGGQFVFDDDALPYQIHVSYGSSSLSKEGMHYHSMPREVKETVHRWLGVIGIPAGSSDANGEELEWGVLSNHGARNIANLRFFEAMRLSRPPWPSKYTGAGHTPGLLDSDDWDELMGDKNTLQGDEDRFHIFYSGGSWDPSVPERYLYPQYPDVCLTYWQIYHNEARTGTRINREIRRRRKIRRYLNAS